MPPRADLIPARPPIIVASATDAGFLPFVEVVATSIAASAAPDRAVHYHILYAGPPNWRTRRLRRFRRGPVTIHLHPMQNPWQRFGTINGFPPSTLLRLSLQDELPPEIERVIYLDLDLVVERDLGALFDLPLHGHAIGAAVDTIVARLLANPGNAKFHHYLRHTLELGDATATYGQAGVMLIDLPALRRSGFQRKMTDALQRFGKELVYVDQCAMNHVLKGDYEVIPSHWNVLRGSIATEPAPGIIHFAGDKPWQKLGMPGGDRWWKHARSLPTFPLFVWRFIRERSRIEVKALLQRLRRPRRTH
jgi:lipopolysaccharide biosynthesis glycosyltransferase